MTLTLVVPTHDKLTYLRATLASLAHRIGEAPGAEVVVVDDGCSDGTTEHLAALAARHAWLRTVRTPHVGLAGARNAGAQAARGTHVLFVDDDVVPGPGCLAALDAHVARTPRAVHIGRLRNVRIGAVPALLDAAAATSFAGFPALDAHTEYHSMYDAARVLFAEAPNGSTPAAWWAVVTGGNLCIPRAALAAAGGFDTSFQHWGPEDADLCYRLFLAGVPARFHDDCPLFHLDHPRDARAIHVAMMRNATLLYKRHGKPPELLAYLRFFNGMMSLREFDATVAERHGLAAMPVRDFHVTMRDVTRQEHVIAWGRA